MDINSKQGDQNYFKIYRVVILRNVKQSARRSMVEGHRTLLVTADESTKDNNNKEKLEKIDNEADSWCFEGKMKRCPVNQITTQNNEVASETGQHSRQRNVS